MGVSRAAYYKWFPVGRKPGTRRGPLAGRLVHPDAITAHEEAQVTRYGRQHTELRHREMAWRMIDENVAFVSASTVYNILLKHDLVNRWERPEPRESAGRSSKPTGRNQRWEVDIYYVGVLGRWYYAIVFIDEYSRYIPYGELLPRMDSDSVSWAGRRALDTLEEGQTPIIQTDNGSAFISLDFRKLLRARGLSHRRIYPSCPQQNAIVERVVRTLKGKAGEFGDVPGLSQAEQIFWETVAWYNQVHLHSALGYLTPEFVHFASSEQVEAFQQERQGKLAWARQNRREHNLRVRELALELPAPEPETTYEPAGLVNTKDFASTNCLISP